MHTTRRRSARSFVRLRSLLVPVVVLLAAAHAAGAQRINRAALAARVDSIAEAALQSGPVAGLSIAVVRGNDTIVMKGYGYADLENDVPATAQTLYRIGSITKQFTSAAVMQLVQEGKINLDDEITKYFPSFPTHGQHILVRHLLNHTSGIPSYTDVGERFGRVARLDLPHDSLLAIVASDSLLFAPGSHFYYNNTGYYMLGMLLEKVTGLPYGTYIEQNLLQPLGIRSTVYCATTPLLKHRAQGYEVHGRQLVNADYISMDLPFAAGSLCSTVGDLVAWTRALSSGRVVSAESYRRMTTPVSLTSGRKMDYGFGLERGATGTHHYIAHGGGINGFISMLMHYPDDSLIVAVLANTAPAPSSQIAENIARAAFGLPLEARPTMPKSLPLTADEATAYVGSYAMVQPDGTRRAVQIIANGGTLELQGAAARNLPLVRVDQHSFAIAGQPGARLNFDIVNGRATGFQFDRGARPLEATRVP